MSKEKHFKSHSVALFALFFLGEGIILLPTNSANEYTFTGYLFCVLSGFIIYSALLPLLNYIFSKEKSSIIIKIIFYSICIFALFCAASTFKSFIFFASKILIPNTAKTISIIIFLLVLIFFFFKSEENILKFCLLSFSFVAIAILFFFFATLGNFNIRNIFVFSFPKLSTLYTQSMPYFRTTLVPSLLLPVWQVLVFKKIRPKEAFAGLLVGTVLLGICILCSVLLFGPQLAGNLDFPYASAVSTVTVGRLFTRLDGFSYYIYFTSALIKIISCLFIVKSLLKKIHD